MVAVNRKCVVLEIPEQSGSGYSRVTPIEELLPWADPYIAALVARLESDSSEQASR